METFQKQIQSLKDYPKILASAINEVKNVNKPVSKGKWTPAQYLQHVAESHAVFYFRMKWILSVDNPLLLGFDGDKWTEDYPIDSIQTSLALIRSIYTKTYNLLNNLKDENWNRTGNHTEIGEVTIRDIFDHFYEHGQSHLKQIQNFS